MSNVGGGINSHVRDAGTMKLTWKAPLNSKTNSALDTTQPVHPLDRAGGHVMNNDAIDETVFSRTKTTERKTPNNYLKKGTGTGGLADTEAKSMMLKSSKART